MDLELHGERINSVLRPAFLAAAGDAHLAEEEMQDLGEIRATLRGFFDAEEAILHYKNTGDFDAARKIFNGADYVVLHYTSSFMLFGGYPPFLTDLVEARSAVESEEELFALYRLEAAKITNDFDREVALLAMNWVAAKDGEWSPGEQVVSNYFEKIWGLDPGRPNFPRLASSVLKGEEINERETTTEDLESLLELLEELLEDSDEPVEAIEFDCTGNRNLAPQVAACLTLMMVADGEISSAEAEQLGSSMSALLEFYNYEDQESLSRDLNEAINSTLRALAPFEEGVAPKGIKKYAKKMAKNITDQKLQALTCYFAIETAGADGLDPLEEEILNLFMSEWGITEDDIAEVEDLL
jgi:hypothetical protein